MNRFHPKTIIIICTGVYSFTLLLVWSYWQNGINKDIGTLGFGYGALVDNLYYHNTYQTCGVHQANICFSAHRLPLITYFLLFFKWLGQSVFMAAVVKILFSTTLISLSFLECWKYCKQKVGLSILILLTIFTPRWALNYVEIGMEEPYIIPLFAYIFAVYLFNKKAPTWPVYFLLTCLLCACMWIKNSLVYFPLVFAVFYFLKFKHRLQFIFMATMVTLSTIGLAYFTYTVSGRFTIASSWEGWNLYKGNNPNTLNYYPEYNLDNLDYLGLIDSDDLLKNEWDYNAYFVNKAKNFIKQNPIIFIKSALVKLYVYFFDFFDSGRPLGEKSYSKDIEIVNSAMLFLIRLVFVIVCVLSFYLWHSKKNIDVNFKLHSLFMLCTILSVAGFHIVGFAYQRHYMPFVLPVMWYAVYLLEHFNDQIPY